MSRVKIYNGDCEKAVALPIRFIVEPESDGAEAVGIILGYRYARMLAYAVGEDGEYRYGLLNGSGEAVWGRSKDGGVDVVLMRMREVNPDNNMATVNLCKEGI